MASNVAISASCCLCCRPLVEGASLRKRKRFHGRSCETFRNLLNKIMAEFNLSINSYRETYDQDAYICHLCTSQVEKYERSKREMESIWQSFCNKILQLNVVVTTTIRKRQSQPPPNADKRCCTTSESQQNSQSIAANQIQEDIAQFQSGAVEVDQPSAVEVTLSSTTETVQSGAVETNIIHHDQTTSTSSPPVSVSKT